MTKKPKLTEKQQHEKALKMLENQLEDSEEELEHYTWLVKSYFPGMINWHKRKLKELEI